MDFEAPGMGVLSAPRGLGWGFCGRGGCKSRAGRGEGASFASIRGHPGLSGDTWIRRAEARCWFEVGSRLRTGNGDVPVNRSAVDLWSGEFLDEHHGSAAAGAKPACGWLCLAAYRRLRGWLRTAPQQLVAEGQQLFPAPIGEESGKANPDEAARQEMEHEAA